MDRFAIQITRAILLLSILSATSCKNRLMNDTGSGTASTPPTANADGSTCFAPAQIEDAKGELLQLHVVGKSAFLTNNRTRLTRTLRQVTFEQIVEAGVSTEKPRCPAEWYWDLPADKSPKDFDVLNAVRVCSGRATLLKYSPQEYFEQKPFAETKLSACSPMVNTKATVQMHSGSENNAQRLRIVIIESQLANDGSAQPAKDRSLFEATNVELAAALMPGKNGTVGNYRNDALASAWATVVGASKEDARTYLADALKSNPNGGTDININPETKGAKLEQEKAALDLIVDALNAFVFYSEK